MPAPQAVHEEAFVVVLYEPAAHEEQVRFAVVDPAVATYWPAAQSLHVAHEVALFVVLYVPAVHDEHTRFVVVVPAVETYSPATHVVIGVHDVCPVFD